jgi:hypothetical protein
MDITLRDIAIRIGTYLAFHPITETSWHVRGLGGDLMGVIKWGMPYYRRNDYIFVPADYVVLGHPSIKEISAFMDEQMEKRKTKK